MRPILAAALFALTYLAGCGAAPNRGPEAGAPLEKVTGRKMAGEEVQVVTSALSWCDFLPCPQTPPPPPNFPVCDGSPAWTDITFNRVRIYQEYPPATEAGWCKEFSPFGTGEGVNLPGWPYYLNDNISTVSVGPEAHVDLYEAANGGQGWLPLSGSPAYRPLVVDLHLLCVSGYPCGYFADRISSLRVCDATATVNGKCP